MALGGGAFWVSPLASRCAYGPLHPLCPVAHVDEPLDPPAVRGVRHAAPVPAYRAFAQECTLTCLLVNRS
jgi:hypothetical protein